MKSPAIALSIALALSLPLPSAAQDAKGKKKNQGPAAHPTVQAPTTWLTLGSVDKRWRQPFNPDTVLLKHIVGDAGPPKADLVHKGTGREAKWKEHKADKNGALSPKQRVAWAYTTLTAPEDLVVTIAARGTSTFFVNGTA
ncbi:MAG: hypothetical protein ACYTDX_00960, partial [Planctomycetota bacterium]